MNKFIGMGRLTHDPTISVYQGKNGQETLARYSIAIDRRGEGADFLNCVAFGRNAEFAEKYLKKGTKIVIEGRIQTGSYTNKDNQKVYTTDIVVEHTEFAESKGSNSNNSSNSSNESEDGFMNINDNIEDEGLPFN